MELHIKLVLLELCLLLMVLIPKKTCELIINSGNDYIAALKGNQPNLFKDVKTNFTPESTCEQLSKGHGRVEKRHISNCQTLDCICLPCGYLYQLAGTNFGIIFCM
jgi:hypothetical protein